MTSTLLQAGRRNVRHAGRLDVRRREKTDGIEKQTKISEVQTSHVSTEKNHISGS